MTILYEIRDLFNSKQRNYESSLIVHFTSLFILHHFDCPLPDGIFIQNARDKMQQFHIQFECLWFLTVGRSCAYANGFPFHEHFTHCWPHDLRSSQFSQNVSNKLIDRLTITAHTYRISHIILKTILKVTTAKTEALTKDAPHEQWSNQIESNKREKDTKELLCREKKNDIIDVWKKWKVIMMRELNCIKSLTY